MNHKSRFGYIALGFVLAIVLLYGLSTCGSSKTNPSEATSVNESYHPIDNDEDEDDDENDNDEKDHDNDDDEKWETEFSLTGFRFGSLAIKNNSFLVFNGNPVSPRIEGTLRFITMFIMDDADVVIIQQGEGKECTTSFYFVTIKSTGIFKITKFGTCSDYITYDKTGSSIMVRLPEYDNKARKTIYAKYVYKNGVVTKNGNVIEDFEDKACKER